EEKESIDGGNLPTQEFPDLERLTSGLSAVFHHEVSANRNVRVLDRKPNPEGSTFPTEIVTCSLDGRGRRLRLFVKYGTKEFDSLYRHRVIFPTRRKSIVTSSNLCGSRHPTSTACIETR